MIRVLLVDDQSLLRTGFRMVLSAEPDIEVVGEAADGSAVPGMVAATSPDVVLMDVRMPGVDGIAATAALTASGATARVLILTTFDLDEYVFAGLRAGASGFLLKDVPPAELTAAIRTVAGGDAVLAPSATRRLIEAFSPLLPTAGGATPTGAERLTERESEVLTLVATGLSNREIAEQLFVSEATVKVHVGRLLAKLGLRDRVQAVVFAYETGFVTRGGAT